MNLYHIGALCNKKGEIVIITAPDGFTWVGDGVAMFRVKGISNENAHQFLNLKANLPVRKVAFSNFESLLSPFLSEVEQDNMCFEMFGLIWNGETFMLYEGAGNKVIAVNKKYMKPLSKNSFNCFISARVKVHGALLIAAPNSTELMAVVLPFRPAGFKEGLQKILDGWEADV